MILPCMSIFWLLILKSYVAFFFHLILCSFFMFFIKTFSSEQIISHKLPLKMFSMACEFFRWESCSCFCNPFLLLNGKLQWTHFIACSFFMWSYQIGSSENWKLQCLHAIVSLKLLSLFYWIITLLDFECISSKSSYIDLRWLNSPFNVSVSLKLLQVLSSNILLVVSTLNDRSSIKSSFSLFYFWSSNTSSLNNETVSSEFLRSSLTLFNCLSFMLIFFTIPYSILLIAS